MDYEHNEDIEREKYEQAKIELSDFEGCLKSKNILALCIIMDLILGALVFWLTYKTYEFNNYTDENYLRKSIILGIIAGFTIPLFTIFYVRSLLELKISRIKRIVLEYEAIFLREEVKTDIFKNSIKMVYKYRDQYYLQTRE